ncbi:PaaI family thioesterase [Fretibacter rubidus]|uniref:PaaI family thioesterase n=1 Tax=Fretibacter rubidus TaxID=570162 RepID=UPI00352A9512
MPITPSKISADDMNAFFLTAFEGGDKTMLPAITHASEGRVIMELAITKAMLRPGGTVSGPTQMAVADHAAYATIFTHHGVTAMALTTNLNIDFLRAPKADSGKENIMVVDAKTIKMGRTLAVISVEMTMKGNPKLASRATVTYAMPKS